MVILLKTETQNRCIFLNFISNLPNGPTTYDTYVENHLERNSHVVYNDIKCVTRCGDDKVKWEYIQKKKKIKTNSKYWNYWVVSIFSDKPDIFVSSTLFFFITLLHVRYYMQSHSTLFLWTLVIYTCLCLFIFSTCIRSLW